MEERQVKYALYRAGLLRSLPSAWITDPDDPRHGTRTGESAHRNSGTKCDVCNPGRNHPGGGRKRKLTPVQRRARAREYAKTGIPRDEVDEMVVDRILGGDWSLARRATVAERELVCYKWAVNWGHPLAKLEKLTGWRTDRYFRWKDYRREAS